MPRPKGRHREAGVEPRYKIVRYYPDLLGELVRLQTHLWTNSSDWNRRYFEWKYIDNPYVSEPQIYLAMLNGKAVGMRGFFGACWETGADRKRTLALHADDMVIDPQHRNRGLVKQIMDYAFEDLARRDFCQLVSLSAGPMTVVSSLALGWKSAGMAGSLSWHSPGRRIVDRLSQGIRRIPGSRRVVRRLPGFFQRSAETLDSIPFRRVAEIRKRWPHLEIHTEPCAGEMAALVQRLARTDLIRHVRDEEYFNWRFKKPLSRYLFLSARKDAELEGYLVLQDYMHSFEKGGVLNIVDFEAANTKSMQDLVQAAQKIAGMRPICIWTGKLDKEDSSLLKSMGFRKVKDRSTVSYPNRHILFRPLGEKYRKQDWTLDGVDTLESANWDLRMIFSERG